MKVDIVMWLPSMTLVRSTRLAALSLLTWNFKGNAIELELNRDSEVERGMRNFGNAAAKRPVNNCLRGTPGMFKWSRR